MQKTIHAYPVLKSLCLTLAAAGCIGASLPALAQAVTDANNNNRFGIDAGTNVTGANNTGIGTNTGSDANGSTNTALGFNSGSNVIGNSNNSLGVQAGGNVQGNGNSAVGNAAGRNVSGDSNLSIGDQAGMNVIGSSNTATGIAAGIEVFGDGNNATGQVAGRGVIGNNNNAMGSNAGAGVQGSDNFSAGQAANAGTVGSRNVAIGVDASTDSTLVNPIDDGIALGSFSRISANGAVALGANSVAGAGNAGWAGVVVNGQVMTNNAPQTASVGVLSVGGNGFSRQITNVADGAVDAASTDAVNGSQLYKTIQAVAGSGIQYDTPAKDSLTLGGADGTRIGNVKAGAVTATSMDAVNGSQLNTVKAVADNSVQYAPSGNAVQLNSNSGNGTVIDNVAAGAVALGSQQAVNGSQLNAVKARADNSVQYDVNGASVQLNANAGAGTAIDNVADGSVAQGSQQAVNGGQLHQTNQSVAAVSQSMSGFNARIDALGQTVQDNQLEARRGIAAAMAMSAAPMPSAPGKTAWAFNAANFKGQSALAASISHRIKASNALAFNAGVTASSGAMGVRIGVSGEF